MHRLLFLDPGHFHATLTLRTPHPRVADEIVVYAPDGPERRDFLALVERFNSRGTRWRVDVVTTDDPLTRLVAERRGDAVILAGRNGGKARTIRRLHDAGFHVLADKPWLVEPEDLDDVRASLAGWPLVTEIMTGRHDVAARVVKRLVDAADAFGEFRAEAPAIEMQSVHHLEKLVDGAPLRRPWWFFDVRVQGSGVVDIPTHLVDRAQWLSACAAPNETPRLVSVRAWPTHVPLASFRRITGEREVPVALQPLVDGDALSYLCNAELELRIGGLTARASARWELAAPAGGGDSSVLVAHGTRADVRLEQSASTGHRRQLLVEPHDARAARAVDGLVSASQSEFPGLRVEDREGRRELVIPAGLDGGHEAHFALVLDQFVRTIDDQRWPADVAARTAAKYAVLADAAGRVLSESPARSPR
jgi:predicted dehydrogenase